MEIEPSIGTGLYILSRKTSFNSCIDMMWVLLDIDECIVSIDIGFRVYSDHASISVIWKQQVVTQHSYKSDFDGKSLLFNLKIKNQVAKDIE